MCWNLLFIIEQLDNITYSSVSFNIEGFLLAETTHLRLNLAKDIFKFNFYAELAIIFVKHLGVTGILLDINGL